MFISIEEKQIIDSLTCERLSSSEENLRLVEGFYNHRNFSCKFMYQPIEGIENAMNAFWANYSTDDEV